MSEDVDKIKEKTIKGGKSYSIITLVSQAVSWAFTFIVIRLLDPSDYGLMAMASVVTAFIMVFSGLGIGAGIVQRDDVNESVLDSLFWFSLAVGVLFSIGVYFLAYVNEIIFNSSEVIPITQLISLIFIITALATVPQNIMSRNYQFKDIAMVNMAAAFISSIFAVGAALYGLGVYTLIWSSIVHELARTVGFFLYSRWSPRLHFDFEQVLPFLKFGIFLSLAAAASKLLESLDKLIIGRAFQESRLGYYSTAMSISNMAIDKIAPLINPIVFPMLSRIKDDPEQTSKVYLRVLSFYLLVTTPIYVGGILVSTELIEVLLGEKWLPIDFMFKAFCFINLFKVLGSFHNVLLTAHGYSQSILKYNFFLMVFIIGGIYVATLYGFNYIAYAWGALFPAVTLAWIFMSLRKFNIKLSHYFSSVYDGVLSSVIMAVSLYLVELFLDSMVDKPGALVKLVVLMLTGMVSFVLALLALQRGMVMDAKQTLFSR